MKSEPKFAVYFCVGVALGTLTRSAVAVPCNGQNLPVCTWAGNDFGFWSLMDTGRIIDFETLPDGSPSHGGVYITPTYNYSGQGVTFYAHLPHPYIAGNSDFGYGLAAYSGSPILQDWIIAQLVNPEQGVGVYFRGGTTLWAYDAAGSLITSVSFQGPGVNEWFLGIRSDIPIARVEVNSGGDIENVTRFSMIHAAVPEPSTAVQLLLGAALLRRPARRFARPNGVT